MKELIGWHLQRFDILSLSLKDTNTLKGIALLFLLFHHLFFSTDYAYNEILIGNKPLINSLAVGLGKYCVALFVFLSGYGLTVSANNNGGIGNWLKFYWKRYKKLMINYWIVWLLFVPIVYFCIGKTFHDAYSDHYFLKLLGDIFGLAHAFGYKAYCSTWWFYSCIIALYLLFPLLYSVRKQFYVLFLFALISHFWGNSFPFFRASWPFQLVFVLGIVMASYKVTPTNLKLVEMLFVVVMVVFSALCRIRESVIVTWQDVILCYFLIVFYANVSKIKIFQKALVVCKV